MNRTTTTILFAALFTVQQFLCSSAGAAEDPRLVLHYQFGTDPGAVVKDLSGHGNDGKIVNATWLREAAGRKGVLRLGTNQSYIDCGKGDAVRIDGDMTFEMWMRLNADATHQHAGAIFMGLNGFQFILANFGTSLVFYYRNSENRLEMMALPADKFMLGDQWTHIAVVVEYPRLRFYQNGKLSRDLFMPFPGVSGAIQNEKTIGNAKPDSTLPMDLSEFRLYRRALGAKEIAAHAQNQEMVPPHHQELAVEPDWYKNTLTVRLTDKACNDSGLQAMFHLLKDDGSDAAPPQSALLKDVSHTGSRFAAETTFPLAHLKGASLEVVATIDRMHIHASRKIHLEKPQWVQNPKGRYAQVMAPWTPVTGKSSAGQVEVDVWGRRYDFSGGMVLKQIQTAGAEILAAPITLTGQAGGKKLQWNDAKVQLAEESDTAAIVEQTGTAQDVALKIRSTTEDDGYTIFDCEVRAQRNLELNQLRIEIPLKSEYATLCYGDRVLPLKKGNPFSEWYSGAVSGNLSFKFSPTIWLGNEDVGLTWQAESDQDWHNADRQKAIEILPDGKTTVFRLNLIDQPFKVSANQALHYKFALLATPVKPLVKDAWSWRIARSEPYGADLNLPDRKTPDGRSALQNEYDLGIRHLFTNVTDNFPWPMPMSDTFSAALHRLVQSAHQHGMKVHPYVIHQRYPVMSTGHDPYALDIMRRPETQYVQGANPPGSVRPGPVAVDYGANSQAAYFFCPKSEPLQDSYIDSLARRLDEYGEDGVYLDGTCHIPPCENTEHGCGYIDAQGKIHPTYPVFAVREFMRRIYTVTKQHDPRAIVDVHCSWGYNPAGLAYADVMWTGEQWWQYRTTGAPDGYISGLLSLPQFRTEFIGRQIGIGAEMLTYRLGSPMKCAAISLLHDISPRLSTSGYDNLAKEKDSYFAQIPAIWKLRDEFGADQAKKLYYWNNQDAVRAAPENCYATLLQHPDHGVLALVSNLSRETRDISLQFNLNRLGLQGRALHTFDALTGKDIQMTPEGQLSVTLGTESWIYIWLRPEAR